MDKIHAVERRRARQFLADSPAWLTRWAIRWADAGTEYAQQALLKEKRQHYDELARCIGLLRPNSRPPAWLQQERDGIGGQS